MTHRHPLILREELATLRKQMDEEWLIRHQPDPRDTTRYREPQPKPVKYACEKRKELH